MFLGPPVLLFWLLLIFSVSSAFYYAAIVGGLFKDSLMAQFRRATNDLRDHVNREFNQDENFREFKDFHQSIDSEIRSIGHTAQEYVEKEVAAEEAELTKLEVDMKGAAKDAMACKNLKDFVEWQTHFAREQFDALFGEATKLSEMGVKTAQEAFSPISERMNVAVEKVLRQTA